jgi:thiazole synthase
MLKISDREFKSRLLLGTGKFPSLEIMEKTITQNASEIVTVSIRRMDLTNAPRENILNYIPKNIQLMPNTSGAQNAKEAIFYAQLARDITSSNWIKLEVISDPHYLLPDSIETLKAAEELVKEGFVVLPYINADPVLAKKLEDVGVAAIMPLGSPIGSNKGIRTSEMIKIMIKQKRVPLIIDAGLGRPSDACIALEMGADAVLVNTAIAIASDPVKMGIAFSLATKSGRMAYEMGIPTTIETASASSPLTGFLNVLQ